MITPATSPSDYEAFGDLVNEYIAWFRTRYRGDPQFVDRVLGHQGLDRELRELATAYGPPNGRTLLARRDGLVCASGAYRGLAAGTCEMKRLFVSDRFKGHGIGRMLADALIDVARADGYRLMRLDTGKLLTEAIAMYRKMGFKDSAPHRAYPANIQSHLVFMELPLLE